MSSLRRHLWQNIGGIFIAVMPLVIFALRPEVLNNRIGDVDTWFYFGHFTSLGDYRSVNNIFFNNYYQTRLPYLIAGFGVFQIFSESWAKAIFAYLVSATSTAALIYVLRAHLSSRVALLVATLLLSDVFFVRSIGWNYVDNGIVAYYALSIAALTAAAKSSSWKRHWVALAAFLFSCAVFVHLGSAVLVIPAIGYAVLVLELDKQTIRESVALVLAAIIGVVVCQIIFGTLNVVLWHNEFFFLRTQLAAGTTEFAYKPGWRSIAEVVMRYGTGPASQTGHWLALHIAVWIVSAAVLAAAIFRWFTLTRYQIYCCASVVILYGLLFLLDTAGLSVFLGRDGLYASFALILSYMTIAGLISNIGNVEAALVGGCFVASLLTRLGFLNGNENFASTPVWLIGIAIALALGLAFFVRSHPARAVSLCLAAALTLLINWKFVSANLVYRGHQIIKQAAGSELPVFLANKADPLYPTLITSIIATFTEKAWFSHIPNFQTQAELSWSGQPWSGQHFAVIVSSEITSLQAAQSLLAPEVDEIVPVGFSHLQNEGGELWVSEFRISKWIGVPLQLKEGQRQPTSVAISAKQLPSLVGNVEGDARVAIGGQTPEGLLSFGPYASMMAGKYLAEIEYGPSEDAQTWDIIVGNRTIAKGVFDQTSAISARVTVPVELATDTNGFQVRSRFSGSGRLVVRSVIIRVVK
jgi:hypothetical protein